MGSVALEQVSQSLEGAASTLAGLRDCRTQAAAGLAAGGEVGARAGAEEGGLAVGLEKQWVFTNVRNREGGRSNRGDSRRDRGGRHPHQQLKQRRRVFLCLREQQRQNDTRALVDAGADLVQAGALLIQAAHAPAGVRYPCRLQGAVTCEGEGWHLASSFAGGFDRPPRPNIPELLGVKHELNSASPPAATPAAVAAPAASLAAAAASACRDMHAVVATRTRAPARGCSDHSPHQGLATGATADCAGVMFVLLKHMFLPALRHGLSALEASISRASLKPHGFMAPSPSPVALHLPAAPLPEDHSCVSVASSFVESQNRFLLTLKAYRRLLHGLLLFLGAPWEKIPLRFTLKKLKALKVEIVQILSKLLKMSAVPVNGGCFHGSEAGGAVRDKPRSLVLLLQGEGLASVQAAVKAGMASLVAEEAVQAGAEDEEADTACSSNTSTTPAEHGFCGAAATQVDLAETVATEREGATKSGQGAKGPIGRTEPLDAEQIWFGTFGKEFTATHSFPKLAQKWCKREGEVSCPGFKRVRTSPPSC